MLDVRVKERLTGAIILVALLVLLVPELLTGRGHSAPAREAPANGEGGQTRSYTIDLADSSASKPVTASTTTPAGETSEAMATDPETNGSSSAESGTALAPSPEGEVAMSTAAPPPSAEPERPLPAPRPNDKPQVARAEPPKPAPRVEVAKSTPPAKTASEPKAAPRATSPEVKAASGWAVQVGSFASRENAERLTRELKGKGFAATVSESSSKGKRLWRVRVGPEADRAAAVALGAKLHSAGHSGGAVVPYP
jgi:DedD protein